MYERRSLGRRKSHYTQASRLGDIIEVGSSQDPNIGMVQLVINAANTMSLRKYLNWIVNLEEVHHYQSIQHAQARDTEYFDEPAIIVLRNLQVLETMYRPGRVMLPSEYTQKMVRAIHETLSRLRLEMEDRFEDISHNSHHMSAGEFVEWVSSQYKVGRHRLELARSGLRHNPDSVRGQQQDVSRAMAYYDSPNVLHETSATNVFADVILTALQSFVVTSPHRPKSDLEITKGLFKSWKQKRDKKKTQRKGTSVMDRRISTLEIEDQLLCQHPSPS